MSGTAPEKCAPAQNLFLAVPVYQGQVSYETFASVFNLALTLRDAGVKTRLSQVVGSCYVDDARNDLAAEFMESGYSDMLFIDADVGFTPDTVLKMALSTKPIVAAIYPKKEADGSLQFPVEFIAGDRWTDQEGALRVKMVPTGLLRINRSVFEHMAKTTHRYVNTNGRKQHAFFWKTYRECSWGEDVEFCREWRKRGGKIHIIPDAHMAHVGFKAWVANLGDAMKAGLA